MNRADLTSRLAFGAAAGLAGTMTMWNLRVGSEKLLPETMEPVKQDPGEFMVEQAEEALPVDAEEQVPGAVETAAAQALHMAYGVTFGILYAMLRPRSGNKLVEGIALGLGTWAVGYLGWLPAIGLVPPVTRHAPKQLLGTLTRHAVYGITTVAAYQQLRESNGEKSRLRAIGSLVKNYI